MLSRRHAQPSGDGAPAVEQGGTEATQNEPARAHHGRGVAAGRGSSPPWTWSGHRTRTSARDSSANSPRLQERFGMLLPTAGTVLDMGRTLTHKMIVGVLEVYPVVAMSPVAASVTGPVHTPRPSRLRTNSVTPACLHGSLPRLHLSPSEALLSHPLPTPAAPCPPRHLLEPS